MESGRLCTGQRQGNKGQQKSVFSQHLVNKGQYFVNKIFNIVSTNAPQNLKYTCQGTKNGNLEVDLGKRGEIFCSKNRKFSAQTFKTATPGQHNSTFDHQKFNV